MLADRLYGLWPSSAQIKNKYASVKASQITPKTSPGNSPPVHINAQFDAALQNLERLLVEYYTSPSPLLNHDFRHTIHEIYKAIIRDENKVFALFQHNVLLLLARVDISQIPLAATADFIGIFDLLLSEITKRYDDYSAEFESVIHRTSKLMGVFLISCLNYSRLSQEKLELISSFVLKLTQYFLTLTELVDHWFLSALLEPDVMFLLTQKKLPVNCFPILELAKDFLFFDDPLSTHAKDTILHIILISCFSTSLEEWILESYLPGLLLTGLLSTFNQLCYGDALKSKVDIIFEELYHSNSSFKEYDDFMKFVMNIISYSSHDTIKIAFLNGLHSKFMVPIVEYFKSDSQFHLNVLVLFTHTLELFVLPSDSNTFTNGIVVDFLLENYFVESEHNLVDLYTSTLRDWREGPSSLTPTFKLLSILSRANWPTLLLATLFSNPTDADDVLEARSILPLAYRAKHLVRLDPELSSLLTSSLDISLKTLQKQLSFLTGPKLLLKFDATHTLSSIICVELYGFFGHARCTNEQLVRMIMDLLFANCGYVTELLCDGKDHGVFAEVMDYLCQCSAQYDLKLRQGLGAIYSIRPRAGLLSELLSLSSISKQRLTLAENNFKDLLAPVQLLSNVELFKVLSVRLYALQRACFTLHKVKYSIDCRLVQATHLYTYT